MQNIHLITPDATLEREYKAMLQEWYNSNEPLVPFVLKYNAEDFKEFVQQLKGFSVGQGLPETYVPFSTFWLVDSMNTILGVTCIRHGLSESLKLEGGHIGYGITPSQRRKGFATKILELGITEARKFGISEIIVTCDTDNTGSRKVILKNGGELTAEYLHNGRMISNFLIQNR